MDQKVNYANRRKGYIDRHPDRLRAPFLLRCGAILIDYLVLVSVLAIFFSIIRLVGGTSTFRESLEKVAYLLLLLIYYFNWVFLAGWTGKTLGKWATGLHIERMDGSPITVLRAFVRHVPGYLISLVPFGLGFIVPLLNDRNRAIHDFIANTVVVRDYRPR